MQQRQQGPLGSQQPHWLEYLTSWNSLQSQSRNEVSIAPMPWVSWMVTPQALGPLLQEKQREVPEHLSLMQQWRVGSEADQALETSKAWHRLSATCGGEERFSVATSSLSHNQAIRPLSSCIL